MLSGCRAPVSKVQCETAREAVLKCYQDKADPLACHDVASAFVSCAREQTEVG